MLKLNNIAAMQIDSQSILVRQGEILYRTVVDLELAVCFRNYEANEYPMVREDSLITWLRAFLSAKNNDDLMKFKTFRDCLAKIETLHGHLPDFQLHLESPATLAKWLDARPDRTISQSFTEFKRLLEESTPEGGRSDAGLPDSVVGPVAWLHVADTHDRFLAEHPGYAARVKESISNSEFVRSMRVRRDQLRRFGQAIVSELEAFQTGSGVTAVSGLIEEAWGPRQKRRLTQLVQKSYDDYYHEGQSGVRTVRSNDGTVVPEVSFENGEPYKWRPMEEFYASDELPGWVKLELRCVDCGEGEAIRRLAMDALTKFLSGPGILNFVDPNDVLLPRFGMGEFEVIVALKDKRRSWSCIRYGSQCYGGAHSSHDSEFVLYDDSIRIPSRYHRIRSVEAYGFMEVAFQLKPKHRTFGDSERRSNLIFSDTGKGCTRTCRTRTISFDIQIAYKSENDVCGGKQGLEVVPTTTASFGTKYKGTPSQAAFSEAIEAIKDSSKIPEPFFVNNPACKDLYLQHFKKQREDLSSHTREKLIHSEEFRAIMQEMSISNAHLRSWITLAFDDVIRHSDVLAGVAWGQTGLPDLNRILADWRAGPASELAERATETVAALERALRSEAMQNAVAHGFSHGVLTGTSFASLDGYQ